ncbi:hypothetical protein [Streptomyces swartbergensis]|uniref:hypothetical protein n=1 Tax=Streptomyces swartbergensis TaxID=487165 RepID=UPI0038107495
MSRVSRFDGRVWTTVDGVEYPLMAMLEGRVEEVTAEPFGRRETLDGLTSWGGLLLTGSADIAERFGEIGELQLRTEDGREGKVHISGITAHAGMLSVTGTGEAPFAID